MHPICKMSVDGVPVAGAFFERLVSLTVVDQAGVKSDTFSADLADGPPDYLALPRKGALVEIELGYLETGTRSMGRFVVDQINGDCLPYGLTISGKAADLRKAKLKDHKERHWDKKTLGDVIGQVAKESGLKARIDPDIAGFKFDWLGQQDESDIHLLHRLSLRHNAVFAIKSGNLIFAKRGAGLGASGQAMQSLIITPDMVVPRTLKFEMNDREKYKRVVGYYQDKAKAKRVEVGRDADPDGDATYRLPQVYGSAAEADKAAEAKSKSLNRGKGSTSVEIPGDTSALPGQPMMYRNVRPGLDGVPWVNKTITHTYSKAGFKTKVEAELYDGQSASKGGAAAKASAASGGGSAPAAPNVPDAPADIPAAPSGWATPAQRA